MDTLVVRESRSSLAGVVMAVAVEGMSVAEAQALMHHGPAGAPRGATCRMEAPCATRSGTFAALRSPAALPRELRGLRGGSPAHGLGGPAPARVRKRRRSGAGVGGARRPRPSAPAGARRTSAPRRGRRLRRHAG